MQFSFCQHLKEITTIDQLEVDMRVIIHYDSGPWADPVRLFKIIKVEKSGTKCDCPTCDCSGMVLTCVSPFGNDDKQGIIEQVHWKTRLERFVYNGHRTSIY